MRATSKNPVVILLASKLGIWLAASVPLTCAGRRIAVLSTVMALRASMAKGAGRNCRRGESAAPSTVISRKRSEAPVPVKMVLKSAKNDSEPTALPSPSSTL